MGLRFVSWVDQGSETHGCGSGCTWADLPSTPIDCQGATEGTLHHTTFFQGLLSLELACCTLLYLYMPALQQLQPEIDTTACLKELDYAG